MCSIKNVFKNFANFTVKSLFNEAAGVFAEHLQTAASEENGLKDRIN